MPTRGQDWYDRYYYQDDDETLDFITLRRVERGEELTISYGEEWWSARDEEPI